ncbi:sigma-70 family RNA polymerase sigma factor [Micromonospora sp. ALFpr18c]|uniref:sigma-70 family RNA polymerase sigma factor n=1 Tax=unclassified Micromonospora TaxID=2617518 RepID=UPI00124B80C2|nr:sigma-70 family RNA polymerase sigma factor [Micromonospora sp. ALFpr18c]KAB1937454.1 sigma-70 family RNA polymerase sigma factor [Micromonospora sp. ALFpr18c]
MQTLSSCAPYAARVGPVRRWEEMVVRPRPGDDDARIRFQHLVSTQGPPLMRFALTLSGGNHSRAEDIVQETMVRAWRGVSTLPADDVDLRRWLFTAARRSSIDEYRRQQARPLATEELDPDTAATHDDVSATVVANDALRDAARRLSAHHRDVLHQVFYLHRSVDEVADELSVPVGTVRSRLHYALRSIRRALAN